MNGRLVSRSASGLIVTRFLGRAFRLTPLALSALTLLSCLPGAKSASVVAWGYDSGVGETNAPSALSDIVAISSRSGVSMALRSNGTVVAWGLNHVNQTNVPPDVTNAVAIANGPTAGFAIKATGEVRAWGGGYYPVTNVPPGLSNIMALEAGERHAIALLADGTVRAWGDNYYGQTNVPVEAADVVAIAAGQRHNTVLKGDGTLLTWGYNEYSITNIPASISNVVALWAGDYHTLALRADDTLLCWGDNYYGQINSPANLKAAWASGGGTFSVAIKPDGSPAMWGADYKGQRNVPAGLTNFAAVAAGENHTVAIIGDSALRVVRPMVDRRVVVGRSAFFWAGVTGTLPFTYRWASNNVPISGATNSVLALNTIQPSFAANYSVIISNRFGAVTNSARLVALPLSITQQPRGQSVALGQTIRLSVQATGPGTITCQWQCNGVDLTGETNLLLEIPNAQINRSGLYTAVLKSDSGTLTSRGALVDVGLVSAWGDNWGGETNVPPGLTNIVAIYAGSSHSLVLRSNGTVVAWGDNAYGDDSGECNVPAGLQGVAAVAAGWAHSLALLTNGTVVAWGYGFTGAYVDYSVPADLTNAIAISAGYMHDLTLRRDGTVSAWGYNHYGQCNVPANLANVVAVLAAGDTSYALKADGTVVAWGDNDYGECNVPSAATNVVALAGKGYGYRSYALALRADGSIIGWGNNAGNQCNAPSGLTNIAALAASGLGSGGSYEGLSTALFENGTVRHWGSFNSRYTNGLSTNLSAISHGGSFSLALIGYGPPTIGSPLADRSALVGSPLYLGASATGELPLRYQWRLYGTNLPGGTNLLLTLPSATFASAGPYSVVISNLRGAVTNSCNVSVAPLGFVSQPANQDLSLGGTISLAVSVSGPADTYRFQWRHDGMPVPGATNSTFIRTNAQSADTGFYSVCVTNSLGGLESARAFVSVGLVVVWGGNAQGQLNLCGGLHDAVAVSSSGNHTLALKADGTVRAWGANNAWQSSIPAAATNAVAISAGTLHSMALQTGGSVLVWGDNSCGQTAVPADLTNAVSIAAGGGHCLALRSDGTVEAWGAGTNDDWQFPNYGQSIIPPGLSNVVAIAAGYLHSLALKSDGTVWAWGAGLWDFGTAPYLGQCYVPDGLSNVVAIAAGSYHSLALKSDGTAVIWGNNTDGQGNVPPDATNLVGLAGGGFHTVVLPASGIPRAWGYGGDGQTTVPASAFNLAQVSAGQRHSVGLFSSGAPYLHAAATHQQVIWGERVLLRAAATGLAPICYQWRLNGTNLPSATNSVLVLDGVEARNGGSYSVFVTNRLGSVTRSMLDLSVLPIQITLEPVDQTTFFGGTAVLQGAASGKGTISYQWEFEGADLPGETHSTLMRSNAAFTVAGQYALRAWNDLASIRSLPCRLDVGLIAAWGDNYSGQTQVPPGLTNVLALACGESHALALNRDGTVAAWGQNEDGEAEVPADLTNAVAIGAGMWHSLAVRANGTVVTWGDAPAVPAGLSNVCAVTAGGYHSLALKRDGTVVAWGENDEGQTNVPAGLTDVRSIGCGYSSSIALRSNGTFVIWGSPEPAITNIPPGLTGVKAFAVSDYHVVALKDNGTVIAWGDNYDGQTNVPPGLSNIIAVSAAGYHSMALRNDGTVFRWGEMPESGINLPDGLRNVTAIASGWSFDVALVQAPPVNSLILSPPARVGGNFVFSFTGETGATYYVEAKEDLRLPDWRSIRVLTGAGAVTQCAIPMTNATRFFRLRQEK